MNLTFAPKEADKAYVAERLWLPKAGIPVDTVKNYLEFVVPGGPDGKQMKLKLWDESRFHLICPREFLSCSDYTKFKFPFVDLRPAFRKVHFKDLVVPRDEGQERAWQALADNDNGILNLACGKGKTRLALKKIAQKGVPTLVVVPDGGILSQWVESIEGDSAAGVKPSLHFKGGLGLIQGPSFDWKHPITLALVTTLYLRIEQGAVPEEMFRHFGLVVYDEVHQIGAPKFSLTAPPFYGDRIGLTATVQREDGLDPIYRYHIGEPFYSDLSQDLIPRIYFQKTGVKVNADRAVINDTMNISVLRTELGRTYWANCARYWAIRQALSEGRKILCLSHSKDQLRLFHAMFPDSVLITQEVKKSERMNILRGSRIAFVIAKLGATGVDDDQLDTLFWLTPYRSKTALQQSMGRIQRRRAGKKTPVWMVFEDDATPPLKNLCLSLVRTLREWNFAVEVLPPQLPQELPPDVRNAYELAFKSLPERAG